MAEWLMAQQTKGSASATRKLTPKAPVSGSGNAIPATRYPLPATGIVVRSQLPSTRYPSLRLVYSVLLNNSTDPVSISVANKPRNMRSGSSTLTAAPFNRSTRNACTA